MVAYLTPSEVPSGWARTLTSADAFREEQRCLASAWTFLGLTIDLEKDGDWIRASIGGRSVFVQRFGTELRGFENRCAHRFFPLRRAERGNGPVICGFHGWQYDREGLAVGIPQCRDVFGTTPRDFGARLARIEIATCGTLIFGRFPSAGGGENLEKFLAEGFPILESMSRVSTPPHCLTDTIKANWKLCMHASLDDYHLVTVHPTTFGRNGPIPVDKVAYPRFGLHISYFYTSKQRPLDDMVRDLREGTFRPAEFSIFHVCPSMFLVLFHAYGPYWYCGIVHYRPDAHDRTTMRAWIYPAPFAAPPSGSLRRLTQWFRTVSEPVRTALVGYVAKRIFREDHGVCEGLQTNAAAVDRAPLQSALETRIGWFEESYRTLVTRGSVARAND